MACCFVMYRAEEMTLEYSWASFSSVLLDSFTSLQNFCPLIPSFPSLIWRSTTIMHCSLIKSSDSASSQICWNTVRGRYNHWILNLGILAYKPGSHLSESASTAPEVGIRSSQDKWPSLCSSHVSCLVVIQPLPSHFNMKWGLFLKNMQP